MLFEGQITSEKDHLGIYTLTVGYFHFQVTDSTIREILETGKGQYSQTKITKEYMAGWVFYRIKIGSGGMWAYISQTSLENALKEISTE